VTPEQFDALFDTFCSTVFRLERLPVYAVGGAEAERLAAFREGRPRPERSVRTSPWLARIAASTAAGKAWQRIRIVDTPLTEYQRYQLESYRESQACGEEILLADRAQVDDLGVDLWLFDAGTPTAHAVLMRYTRGGRFERFDPIHDPDHLEEFQMWQRRTWARAVPLNTFLAQAAGV
jgi:hypothetical protein